MLNKHDYRYKNYLKLEKKMREVWEKLCQVPWIAVGKPFKDGWYIFYDLRKDVSARKDADIIRAAISRGFHRSFTRNEAHVRLIRGGKKSAKGRKGKTIDLSPAKDFLTVKEYEALDIRIKKYFELDDLHERFRKWGIKNYKIKIPYYWLVLRVKGRVVTHIQKKGGELESEYQFLRDQYYSYFDLGTNYGKSYPCYKDRAKVRAAIQRFKNGDAEDICIEKVPMEYEY